MLRYHRDGAHRLNLYYSSKCMGGIRSLLAFQVLIPLCLVRLRSSPSLIVHVLILYSTSTKGTFPRTSHHCYHQLTSDIHDIALHGSVHTLMWFSRMTP